MTQKTILITGCSSGIGECVARGLAARGWRVFASARTEEALGKLSSFGLEAIKLDVADSKSISLALEQVLTLTGGTLDVLFNNAGYAQAGAVEDLSRDLLREQFETNLFGAWELTTLVLPVMRKQGHGRLLFNSSIVGFAAVKWLGAYTASKFALEGMCDTLRQELIGSGIYASLLEPGPIVSNFRECKQKKLFANIDVENSVHKKVYQDRQEKEPESIFMLPAEACLLACLKALKSKHPAARYKVTVPTHVIWYLKRILPTRCLDFVLNRAA